MTDLTAENLKSELYRLNSLYKIRDKDGRVVTFAMNPVQRHIYDHLWYLSICLKARQLGCTSFVQIFMLDRCLFNENTTAGVIAHTIEDASAFFDDKIKFAYDNLPEELKQAIPAKVSNTRELTFANGSKIRVGTSMRSGTLQYLHVSEFGKICAKYPDKAKEVITGSLNTVAPGNFVFIESTAEGRQGHFYDMCLKAQAMAKQGQQLTALDYKFFFFNWAWDPRYRLPNMVNETIPDEYRTYFDKLEAEETEYLPAGYLTTEQKQWYIVKSREQGREMKQEYPSTPAEAFEKNLEGSIFGTQVQDARHDQRVLDLPFERGVPVNTFWDLGRNDVNAIWFHQRVGPWDHFINYYEHRLVDIMHYVEVLNDYAKDQGYRWGTMYLPHDGKTLHIESIAGSAKDILQAHGFRVKVTNRPTVKNISIEATRRQFAHCRFDRIRCDLGLANLENYQWSWDEKHACYRNQPLHNSASNGADAFQTYGHGYSGEKMLYLPKQLARLDKRKGRTYGDTRRNPTPTPNYDHIV